MGYKFLELATTPAVKAAQAANGSATVYDRFTGHRDFVQFTPAELEFIAERDSFYMATVSETGWPYVQHRGGPPGFLRALDDRTLACADFRGNRQYISVGNLTANDRASLFLMDYPNRRRLKMYVHVEVRTAADDPKTLESIAMPGYPGKVERALVFHLDAFDWNCPQHITPRFTESELSEALEPIRLRMEKLEAENKRLQYELQQASGVARLP